MSVQKRSLFADRLRGMQDQANQAMVNYTPAGVRVPDGVYNCKQACEMKETQGGKLKIARTFTVAEGEFKGLNIWDSLVIEGNETGLQIARRWVELHGVPWPEDDLAALEPIVNQINDAGLMVQIRSKTSGDFVNVNVNKILDAALPTANATPPAAPAAKPAAGKPGPKPAAQKPATAPAARPAAPAAAPAPAVPSLQATNMALKNGTKPAPAASAGDELAAMSRAELKALIGHQNLSVRVTLKMSDEDIRNEIRKVMSVNAAETQVEATDQKLLIKNLCVLCAAQGVEGVTDAMSADEIAEVMSGYQYTRGELTEEEVALMTQIGIAGQIVG